VEVPSYYPWPYSTYSNRSVIHSDASRANAPVVATPSYLCSLQTLSMFLARMVFFRLHESPRYLVHAGRPQDAVKSLQLISRFNGSDISIELEDVRDYQCYDTPTEGDISKSDGRSRANSTTPFAANVVPDGPNLITADPSTENSQARSVPITDYASTRETPNRTDSTPEQHEPSDSATEPMLKDVAATAGESLPRNNLHLIRQRRAPSASRQSFVYRKKVCRILPRWLRRLLWAWWDRVMMVLAPEWQRTTVLVWLAWFAMSLGPSNFLMAIHPFNFPQSLTIFFSFFQLIQCLMSSFQSCWKADHQVLMCLRRWNRVYGML
jgi:hypothetical protein